MTDQHSFSLSQNPSQNSPQKMASETFVYGQSDFIHSLSEFDELLKQHMNVTNLLAKGLELYQKDPNVKRYNVREIALNLFTADRTARSCSQFYQTRYAFAALTPIQRLAVDLRWAQMQSQCDKVHVKHTEPSPVLNLMPAYQDALPDVEKTQRQLHLLKHYANGLLKITRAVSGKDIQMIIDETGFFATMSSEDKLRIDISKFLMNAQLVAHVITHEIGHADYNQYFGYSKVLPHVMNLEYYRPYFIDEMTAESKKDEMLADTFSAITAALFGIDLNVVYSRFSAIPAGETTNDYLSYPERAQIAQEVVSSLSHYFNEPGFWKDFAEELRSIPQLSYSAMPTFEQIDKIYDTFPGNTMQQELELRRQFSSLFTPNIYGENPLPVVVVADLVKKILDKAANAQFPSTVIQTIPKATTSAFITVEQFQAQFERQVALANPTVVTCSSAGCTQPAEPVNNLWQPAVIPLSQQPLAFRVRRAVPRVESPRDRVRSPFLPPSAFRPHRYEGEMSLDMGKQMDNLVSDGVTSNAMLALVISKMAKNTISFLSPRWMPAQPVSILPLKETDELSKVSKTKYI
jgi:hypothetical protein